MTGTSPTTQADEQTLSREGAPGTHPEFDRLVRTIWRLRQPDGCPWDKVQTHDSIARNMIEEAYETLDAIERGSDRHLCEELGDVMMQILLHAQIADDEGAYDIDTVCRGLNEKLVRRHPHVFGELGADNPDEVLDIWESVKAGEREAEGAQEEARPGLLDSVPRSLPALMPCQKISKRAARAGFEWDTVEDVWDKVEEERREFLAEERGTAAAEMEFGDLLFALVNVARHEGIDAEAALRASNDKFRRRWAAMEARANLDGLSTEELNRLWDEVK